MKARVLAGCAALMLIGAACGSDDRIARPGQSGVIEVTMTENRFEPARVRVEAGETVTYRFENDGALRHEAYVGDEAAQQAHQREMAAMADMPDMPEHDMTERADSGHSGESELRVDPGARGSLQLAFDNPGTVLVACHEPGHWESGMKMTIEVV